ncbi:MAG: hypothetical protein GY953_21625 [bacterium]|nr:hypothetical protein [bacterium]
MLRVSGPLVATVALVGVGDNPYWVIALGCFVAFAYHAWLANLYALAADGVTPRGVGLVVGIGFAGVLVAQSGGGIVVGWIDHLPLLLALIGAGPVFATIAVHFLGRERTAPPPPPA